MQLIDIREMLSGWLQDSLNVQWTTIRMNRIINLALRETEKHILSHDPEAFKCTYTAATTVPSAGRDNLYAYPAGTFAVHEIALSSDGINYVPLSRRSLRHCREAQQSGMSSLGFIPYTASHFILYPPRTTAVTAGIRIIVAPTLVMSADNDDLPLPLGFETMMMKQAQIFCLFDVGEPTDKLTAELNDMKKETPRFFLTATEPAFLEPVVDRYGSTE